MNRLNSVLDLTLPLLQAGMGGVANVALAAAVSAEGAGGTLGLYKQSPDHVRQAVAVTAAATSGAFGVNIIPEVVGPAGARRQVVAATECLPANGFVSFFGLPDAATAAAATHTGHRIVIEVGTVTDADAALGLGADLVVLQGTEAGGHLLGTSTAVQLLHEVRARHPLAVLAIAGGIATGTDLARALANGADGAMAGTLFVPADESDAHPMFKCRVLAATSADTTTTSLFKIGWPARPHRVLRNAVTESPEQLPARFIASTVFEGRRLPIPRYSAASPSTDTTGRIAEMAMYCGCSCERVATARSVATLLDQFRREFTAATAAGEES